MSNKSISRKVSDYTVIDIETTGFSGEIIELAALKVRNDIVVADYSTLIKPESDIETKIVNLTGITNEMVSSAPTISEKLQEFLDFIDDDIVVGHNVGGFDIKMINDACHSIGIEPMNNSYIDTLNYSRHCDIYVENHKLPTLANYFGITYDAHRALNDCEATHLLYQQIRDMYDEKIYRTSMVTKIPDNYVPIDCEGKIIVVTGEFSFASREKVEEMIKLAGGIVKSSVSGKTNYVVIGSLGSKSWSYGNYGSKIQRATELIKEGKDISIVNEEEFFINTDNAEESSGFEIPVLSEIVKTISEKLIESHNIPENFIKCTSNINSMSIWLIEPVTNKQSKMVFSISEKGRTGSKYYSLTLKNNAVDKINISDDITLTQRPSDRLNAYFSFTEFDETVVSLIEELITWYVENFEPSDKFGCCSKYKECSQAGMCLHNNKFYSKACWYRKNLEDGKVFY